MLTDIRLVAFDADLATLTAHLDAHPRWTKIHDGAVEVTYGWDGHTSLAYTIELPAAKWDTPAYAEETRAQCAQAAVEINALELDLPTGTPAEAVRRLAHIADLARWRNPAWPYPSLTTIYTTATGQDRTLEATN